MIIQNKYNAKNSDPSQIPSLMSTISLAIVLDEETVSLFLADDHGSLLALQ